MNEILYALMELISKESLRFQFCHEQGFDTSCGLTVVATVLDHYWGVPVSEYELIEKIIAEKLAADDYSVSLSDLSEAFRIYGLSSKAFKMDWDALALMVQKGYSPLIVHYDKPEKHFGLILGFNGDTVITLDPARGIESLSRQTFMSRYSGSAMLVASQSKKPDAAKIKKAIDWSEGRRLALEQEAERFMGKW